MLVTPLVVYPDAEFNTFGVAAHAEVPGPLEAALLVRIDGQGRLEDHFRIALRGKGPLQTEFAAEELLADPAFGGFIFQCDTPPGQIRLKANLFTTRWEDLEPLIAGGGAPCGR